MSIERLGLIEVRDKIRSGAITSSEVVKASLEQIEKNKDLNALITVDGEGAIKRAREIDEAIKNGKDCGLLCGVPITIKDNISTEGVRTTCGSRMLENYIPPYDATVIERLKSEGAIIIAKANMDEFGMGSSGENSAFGVVKNPVDKSKVSGGSSSGSAVAVASFQGYGSLGSDTGGSIRLPSSYCGVVGLKPTYSTVSRYGLIAYASSLDQIGPITRSVKDNALLLSAIAGYDYRDSTSVKIPTDFTNYERGVKGKTIGLPREFFNSDYSSEVTEKVITVSKIYEKLGAKLVEVTLGNLDLALASYYVIASAEASSNLARFDGIKYGEREEGEGYIDICYNSRTKGFGDEVKRRIMMGNYVLSSGYYDKYYLKAIRARALIKEQFSTALNLCDILLLPTVPSTAFEIGKKRKNSTEIYYEDIFTALINLAGNPALSLPCGADKNGLPIGVQLIGNRYGERTLYGFGETLEEEMK